MVVARRPLQAEQDAVEEDAVALERIPAVHLVGLEALLAGGAREQDRDVCGEIADGITIDALAAAAWVVAAGVHQQQALAGLFAEPLSNSVMPISVAGPA